MVNVMIKRQDGPDAPPRWEEFQDVRARYGAIGRFQSLQSVRLGLE